MAQILSYASALQRKLSDDLLENEQQLGLVIIHTLCLTLVSDGNRVT